MMPDAQRFVASDAQLRDLSLRPFDVPYKIEGVIRVYATDAETAKELVDCRAPSHYADDGVLETFPAKAVEDVQ